MEAGLHSCFEKKGGLDSIGLIQVWAESVPYISNWESSGRAPRVGRRRGFYQVTFSMGCVPALL